MIDIKTIINDNNNISSKMLDVCIDDIKKATRSQIAKKTNIPEGSYLAKDANAKLPNPKLGHISASCWSVEFNNPCSLAILHDGKNMIGQKLFALSPLKNKSIPVEIISSHYVDPKGERVRS